MAEQLDREDLLETLLALVFDGWGFREALIYIAQCNKLTAHQMGLLKEDYENRED